MKVYQVQIPSIATEAPTPQEALLGVVRLVLAGKIQVTVTEKGRALFSKKRHTGPAHPQSWWPMGQMAQVMCPLGHTNTLLAENHTILPNGEVSPSVVCGAEGCPFHSHIKLEGWEV